MGLLTPSHLTAVAMVVGAGSLALVTAQLLGLEITGALPLRGKWLVCFLTALGALCTATGCMLAPPQASVLSLGALVVLPSWLLLLTPCLAASLLREFALECRRCRQPRRQCACPEGPAGRR